MENINITASSIESFKNVEALLSKLPECITDQIESAGFMGVGLQCQIRDKFETNQRIILPNKVTQISHFDDYVGIYCDKYFFKVVGDLYKRKCEFVFIECEGL
jgi:hypothetical protein